MTADSRLVVQLGLSPSLLPSILDGSKRTTIRKGHVVPALPIFDFVTEGGQRVRVRVRFAEYGKTMNTLSEDDARLDGFASLTELKATLLAFYPALRPTDLLTIIGFELEEKQG